MKTLLLTILYSTTLFMTASALDTISLPKPDLTRGDTIMQAFAKRRSTREFATKELSRQDLADLLWAANGINRPESGKRTAPSAMNRQDVKLYVCTPQVSYLYDHKKHQLLPLSQGDARPEQAAPICLILVTDTNQSWAAIDAGIVSQNISIFCAGVNLATCPKASIKNKSQLAKSLKLQGQQTIMLYHPIGHFNK